MYIKTKNGGLEKYPYYLTDFINDNPNLSFRRPAPLDLLAEYDVYPVRQATEKPSYNSTTQYLESQTQPSLIDGEWVMGWNVVNYSDEKIAKFSRIKRNDLLRETDHYALSDRTMTDEMRSYRQFLRDLPEHENWPNLTDDDWPVAP